jgi:hypothetical protein
MELCLVSLPLATEVAAVDPEAVRVMAAEPSAL